MSYTPELNGDGEQRTTSSCKSVLVGTNTGKASLGEEKSWKNVRLAAFDLECTDFFSCS